jgi:two-component system LytT family response regulator
MNSRITALLIDDERLARVELRRLLEAHPEVEIVGEARDGRDALEKIAALRPSLLFLDVQMPGLSGFEMLEQLEDPPQVIFTTAFDQHAVKAFESNALDYLLKPVVPARLAASLKRVSPPSPRDDDPLPAVSLKPLERVFVRDGERCWMVDLKDIVLFESEGNYTRLYFGKERPLILRSLTSLEERLDPAQYFRASRRHLVNLSSIVKVDPGVADNLILTLLGGIEVEMSRRQSARLREIMSL